MSSLELIQKRARMARQETKNARDALEQAERISGFWNVLLGHLSQEEFGSVLLHLDRNAEYVRSLRDAGDPIASVLDSYRNDAQARAQTLVRALGRSFPEAVRQAGLGIDPSSRHPKYAFRDGFIRLEFDEKRLIAKVSNREGEERQYGLDLDLLVRVLQREHSRLFDRDFKSEPFLRSLYTAYSAVLRAEGLADGTEVPIRRVMHRLAKNLNRFSADEFNVDLASIIQSGHTTVDGHKLHLNHTRNTRQGLLLYGLEQGGYVGFISFKREEPR